MAEWTSSKPEKMDEGFIRVVSLDYGNAVGVLFFGVTGFQVPNDVLREELAEMLEKTAIVLREGTSAFFTPIRYRKERGEYIRQLQREEQAEELEQTGGKG